MLHKSKKFFCLDTGQLCIGIILSQASIVMKMKTSFLNHFYRRVQRRVAQIILKACGTTMTDAVQEVIEITT